MGYICGLDAAMDVVGGKWKALILWELQSGSRRPGELRRALTGISEKMLIQQLRALEADGIVSRTVHNEIPPRVDYALTDRGRTLNDALGPLGDWGEAHMDEIAATRAEPAAAAPR